MDKLVREYAIFFQREDPAEMTSMVMTCLIAVFTATLTAFNVSSTAWCVAWMVILLVALPVEGYALSRVVRKHNRLLDRLAEAQVDVDEPMRA